MSQFLNLAKIEILLQLIINQMEPEDDIRDKDKKNNKHRVRVAIRVRPMISRETTISENSCIEYSPPRSIIIGKDRCFTFDQVFNEKSTQNQIYQKCVKQLVLACFEGYNAAVLAYGQTGSGKTYTMGTGAFEMQDQDQMGIVPRVIKQIFEQIQKKRENRIIIVKASFIQIYNEQIIDLLSNNISSISQNAKGNKHSISKDLSNMPTIRQQKDGSISLVNVIEQTVTDYNQMRNLLHKGGNNRSTSSTLMNDCSSRSHGIFSIQIQQHSNSKQEQDEGFITAKFYFVDLAGSERAKKTGASGLTLKQGININLGLLQLGNVISALSVCDRKQNQFITYRNSKLTRILQDSLGGNSNTYMISCISPAQSNYQQSLNTIKYSTKAMNIKNKPIINRDPHSAQVNALKQKILQLEIENKNIKKLLCDSGIQVASSNFARNDARSDILGEQIRKLRNKIIDYERLIDKMENQLKQRSKRKNQLQIQNYELKRDRDRYKLKMQIEKQRKNSDKKFSINTVIEEELQCEDEELGLMQEYQNKIRHLQSQLFEQQKINNQLQQEHEKLCRQMQKDEQIIVQKNKEIGKLKGCIKEIINQKREQRNSNNFQLTNSQPTSNVMRVVYKQNDFSQEESLENSICQQQIEQLQENEQFKEAEADYRASTNAQNEKLYQVQSQIRQQQQKLQAMTQDQINLQYQLISQMKEEYQQKIISLQKEKQAIIKQQEQMAGYQKNPKLKQKVENLQLQLRQLRKKAKDQTTLQKQVSLQSEQIKKLASEIKMHKVQKIEINRKIKQDRNAYDKFKKERIKQISVAKKENIRKDKQIRRLALQNKKKTIQMTRKVEQLNRIKKVNEAIRNFTKQNKKQQKKNLKNLSVQKSKSNPNQRSIDQMDSEISSIINLHNESMKNVIFQEQLKIEMDKYDKKIEQLQNQIQKINNEQASLQMKLDRIQINKNYESFYASYEMKPQQQELKASISQIKQRISTIEQNIVYCQHRYNELGAKLPNFNEQIDIINNLSMNSIQKLQMMLKLIYQSLRIFVSNGITHYKKLQLTTAENQDLKEHLQRSKQQLGKTISQHQTYLGRLREEMMNKYYSNIQENLYDNAYSNSNSIPTTINRVNSNGQPKIDDRQRKNYERKIFDLTKTNRQLSADVQMWRRKCSVVQQKYHNINMRMAKDKFIGRQREDETGVKKNGAGWNIGGLNSLNISNTAQMIEQVNQMIDKIENKKKTGNVSEDEDQRQSNRTNQDAEFSRNKWDCLMTLKASRSPILSMAVLDNLLITSATKSISIWDQQSCKMMADLSNPNYLQGFVKSVITIPEYNYIAAACQKQVFIWDIRSYNSIAVLKGHKDQVRCLYQLGNCLFSSGKGSSTSGGLLMWDLRMLDSQTPFDEKQKNIDIFAMTSHENTLYYGTRNHQVRRLTLQNREVLTPFEPPHMDTVTSLTVINNYLVSGSKDKNLRLWALDCFPNNIKCTTHAFNDYVNVVQTDKKLPIFYSGSRDGQVKVATVVDEKIKFVGGIIAHTQSVNSICSTGSRHQGLFLTGSADKTVKFWKPDPFTLEKLNTNQNY